MGGVDGLVLHFHVERDPQTYESVESVMSRVEARLNLWTLRSAEFRVTGCVNSECRVLRENDLYRESSLKISHFPCNHDEVSYPKGSWTVEGLRTR